MEQVRIASKVATEIFMARQLLEQAHDILLAQELIKGKEYAPDLLPIAKNLLLVANGKHLYEAEQALKDE